MRYFSEQFNCWYVDEKLKWMVNNFSSQIEISRSFSKHDIEYFILKSVNERANSRFYPRDLKRRLLNGCFCSNILSRRTSACSHRSNQEAKTFSLHHGDESSNQIDSVDFMRVSLISITSKIGRHTERFFQWKSPTLTLVAFLSAVDHISKQNIVYFQYHWYFIKTCILIIWDCNSSTSTISAGEIVHRCASVHIHFDVVILQCLHRTKSLISSLLSTSTCKKLKSIPTIISLFLEKKFDFDREKKKTLLCDRYLSRKRNERERLFFVYRKIKVIKTTGNFQLDSFITHLQWLWIAL